ncbi:UDP-N-acetylglucosamine:LPS N-acetylglucosamine transferase [Actinopolyspora xinjiangensis]|uniref:UDP-N-acetylglucosamine:LPS N-acetylglucosamine transferase n=1 Tax=Actinopolyspora xinjiangensis TaxID=405564 RepID=A0A1H0WNJ3_9ACTN|nr:WS/DGAT domain-containing protein [Actinopolyspora xinjiangensis]SDP92233.1 UDP-N-acetylglucosamine:LPS N-acetylglucosamine transferase [Actinopolyspora xinjiangensis]
MTSHEPNRRPPERILLVSADIGEGHNATARAVEEAARRLWPGCEITRLDTLRVMGPGVGPLFRWIYVRNVESTPWLYNLFYDALWRWRWFATASRRFVGAWVGPLLRRRMRRWQPDLVISTYPMATAGLDRMRRRGEARVPIAAFVSDFCPHPFWVYPEIDLHYVMSETSLRALYRAQPDATGAVSVPPVTSAFRPGERHGARLELGLPAEGFQVLIACGSLSFGSVERAVDTALAEPAVDLVIVACGRNEELRGRLSERDEAAGKLLPLGWVEDMPDLTAAADVVVSNAGGATALETMACGRTMIMFEPIAGHGRANAELMARAGLAELCPTSESLAVTLREFATTPERLRRDEQRVLEQATAGDLTQQVAALTELPRHRGARRLHHSDRFFVHAANAVVAQQTGAILRLRGGPEERTAGQWADYLAGLIERRARTLPMLHSVLVERGSRGPRWYTARTIEPWEHLEHRTTGDREEVVREFFTAAVPTDRPPWQLMVLRSGDETLILAKLHHALGDGIAVTNTLVRLLRDAPEDVERAPRPHGRTSKRPVSIPRLRSLVRSRTHEALTVVRGLCGLAAAGPAPRSPLDGDSTSARVFGTAELPASEVRARARARGIPTSVLLIGLTAEALHRTLAERTGTTTGQYVRVMVPRTTRSPRDSSGAGMFGNHTVAVSVDLPVGPMSAEQRLREVSERLLAGQHDGQPAAAGIAMAVLGALPTPLHRLVVRSIYQRRFFNALVSAMPGSRRPPRVWGALVAEVLPILPLAPGVGTAIGLINWGETVGIGITADARLEWLPSLVAERLRECFEELRDRSGTATQPETTREEARR